MTNEEEFARRLADLDARERELAKRERAASAAGIRYNIYERVTLSKGALDVIIIACAAAIVALTIVGYCMAKS